MKKCIIAILAVLFIFSCVETMASVPPANPPSPPIDSQAQSGDTQQDDCGCKFRTDANVELAYPLLILHFPNIDGKKRDLSFKVPNDHLEIIRSLHGKTVEVDIRFFSNGGSTCVVVDFPPDENGRILTIVGC